MPRPQQPPFTLAPHRVELNPAPISMMNNPLHPIRSRNFSHTTPFTPTILDSPTDVVITVPTSTASSANQPSKHQNVLWLMLVTIDKYRKTLLALGLTLCALSGAGAFVSLLMKAKLETIFALLYVTAAGASLSLPSIIHRCIYGKQPVDSIDSPHSSAIETLSPRLSPVANSPHSSALETPLSQTTPSHVFSEDPTPDVARSPVQRHVNNSAPSLPSVACPDPGMPSPSTYGQQAGRYSRNATALPIHVHRSSSALPEVKVTSAISRFIPGGHTDPRLSLIELRLAQFRQERAQPARPNMIITNINNRAGAVLSPTAIATATSPQRPTDTSSPHCRTSIAAVMHNLTPRANLRPMASRQARQASTM